ncbi:Uncharacterized protein conserved in bacteria [Thermoplasmatales archaeon BRNA1]|nr:Uncharacterized protein conserved in bacteria [Thermoplasmatales archaeon BRNA1]
MEGTERIYGISVNVPASHSDALMDAIDKVMEPVYPGYSRTFCIMPCKGTWRTEEGADPFDGKVGEITVADEIRIKFVCREKDLENVLKIIDRVHPYEEPAVDVVPQIAWRSLIH